MSSWSITRKKVVIQSVSEPSPEQNIWTEKETRGYKKIRNKKFHNLQLLLAIYYQGTRINTDEMDRIYIMIVMVNS